MNHQTIDEIIARFGRAGWLVQKTNEGYWTVRPKGLYDYKLFLLIYNPFDDKFQLVAPPTPHDPHYERALKILGEAIAPGAVDDSWLKAIAKYN